jgi:hypothetical protein
MQIVSEAAIAAGDAVEQHRLPPAADWPDGSRRRRFVRASPSALPARTRRDGGAAVVLYADEEQLKVTDLTQPGRHHIPGRGRLARRQTDVPAGLAPAQSAVAGLQRLLTAAGPALADGVFARELPARGQSLPVNTPQARQPSQLVAGLR